MCTLFSCSLWRKSAYYTEFIVGKLCTLFAIILLQIQFIKTRAPQLIKNAEVDIANVEQTVDQLRAEDDQLVGDVCNHLADVQPLVSMLVTLTDQIQQLEKYSKYLQCLAHIEDLRFFSLDFF